MLTRWRAIDFLEKAADGVVRMRKFLEIHQKYQYTHTQLTRPLARLLGMAMGGERERERKQKKNQDDMNIFQKTAAYLS